ncbi:hypothetical protein J5H42_00985 [Aeromonas dhakensis]|uniref:hypothetical protein n=1 Tax=Aeromonas dhakensis TaxID=196024 RepID=UPI001AAED190|nr:hypothetical protein [Aeromonas dhakensis]MBO2899351.1 hypothetical protein [Aeromonas dhakensis]MBO2994921.1 hypothetical protein [Aeromonas dhakensis]
MNSAAGLLYGSRHKIYFMRNLSLIYWQKTDVLAYAINIQLALFVNISISASLQPDMASLHASISIFIICRVLCRGYWPSRFVAEKTGISMQLSQIGVAGAAPLRRFANTCGHRLALGCDPRYEHPLAGRQTMVAGAPGSAPLLLPARKEPDDRAEHLSARSGKKSRQL